MKVLIEIFGSKAAFALEVLRNLVFVKKIKAISIEKSQLMEEIKEATQNFNLVKEGKMKAKPVRELLNEL